MGKGYTGMMVLCKGMEKKMETTVGIILYRGSIALCWGFGFEFSGCGHGIGCSLVCLCVTGNPPHDHPEFKQFRV